MRFSFITGVIINFKGKLNEKFCDVIKRFRKKECPEELKHFTYNHIMNGIDNINYNKTLFENNIDNGNTILFTNLNTYNNNDTKEELTDDEKKEQIIKWTKEFQTLKLIEYIKKIISMDDDEKEENIPEFNEEPDTDELMEFISEKIEELGLKTKEHDHKLIYCLTNFDWECNKCKNKYDKNISKHYCSVCDYNMCDKCRAIDEYVQPSPFTQKTDNYNKNIKEKYKEIKEHPHKLVYCLTSRSLVFYGWICKNCNRFFESDIWSFYCTNCNFDLCTECLGYY